MAVTSINQYLLDFLRNNAGQSSEIKLNPKNNNFDLYSIYLESLDQEVSDYLSDTATVLLVLSGQAKLKVGNYHNDLEQGNIVFLNNKSKYQLNLSDQDTLLIKFKMKPGFKWNNLLSSDYRNHQEEQVAATFEMNLLQNGFCIFKTTSVMQASQYLKQMLEEYINGNLFELEAAKAYLKLILITSLRTQLFNDNTINTENRFGRYSLDEYIDSHYDNISLTEAAAHFGFNKNYFSSLVKEKTGKSFVEHVDERRMKEAKQLLALPNVSLEEIIKRVGFSSKSFFYKKFNRYYGMTPIAMRKQLFKEANINLR